MSANPLALRVLRASRLLEVEWSDGSTGRLAFDALRAACRCAECESARRKSAAITAGNIDILDIVPYGANAIQLRFSDGHERGIYPFAFLRELQEGAANAR